MNHEPEDVNYRSIPSETNPLYPGLCKDEDHVQHITDDAASGLVSLAKIPRPLNIDEWNTIRNSGRPVSDEWATSYGELRDELRQANLIEETVSGSATYQPTRLGFAAVAMLLVQASWRLAELDVA